MIWDLKFNQHIAKKINKANSMLALIKGTFQYLDNHSFLRLYTTIVRTHLEFANFVWHPYLQKDIESIEQVQMRATKLVSNLKDLPYETRLKERKLPTLAHRRLRGDMIQTFKLVKGLDDCLLEKFFTIAYYNKRGHACKPEKPRCSLSHTKSPYDEGLKKDLSLHLSPKTIFKVHVSSSRYYLIITSGVIGMVEKY